jgi:uncharacterized protein involved in response to NO
MWATFCMMQGAALLRLLGELPLPGVGVVLIWLSSVVWIAAFAVWGVAYAPLLWRPRTDGKAG